jgi:Holliday junction resolvase
MVQPPTPQHEPGYPLPLTETERAAMSLEEQAVEELKRFASMFRATLALAEKLGNAAEVERQIEARRKVLDEIDQSMAAARVRLDAN